MNEQIAQWREEFEAAYGDEHTPTDSFGNYIYYHQDLQFRGYVIARTEQATEIAKLKEHKQWYDEAMIATNVAGYAGMSATQVIEAMHTEIAQLKTQVTELIPIAKFGAMVAAAHMADDLIDAEDLTDGMLAAELLTDDNGVTNYVDGIEEKIMEVLR
jgi:hypothetical protein